MNRKFRLVWFTLSFFGATSVIGILLSAGIDGAVDAVGGNVGHNRLARFMQHVPTYGLGWWLFEDRP